MRTILYPYKMGSQSGRQVAEDITALRVHPNRAYRPRRGDFIINWGSSTVPRWMDAAEEVEAMIFNHPEAVGRASNKLRTLEILRDAGVPHIPFTTDPYEATDWEKVFCRHNLNGHSGDGIDVRRRGEGLPPNARMYTKGIENAGEYRIHVLNGRVIDYQKKRRRREDPADGEAEDVRNLTTGWIYTRGNLRHLERIESLAIEAVEALGLDFGAVDIIKDNNGDVYVLEVNTACGMSETTRRTYQREFSNLISEYASI